MPEGQRPRGVTPCLRSGPVAESARLRQRRNAEKSYPASASEARGSGGRSNPMPKARGGGREEQPHVQGAVAVRTKEGLEELFHVKVRRGSGEEIPLVQGNEQQLCFAGAAVKRYPTSKVRETQVR